MYNILNTEQDGTTLLIILNNIYNNYINIICDNQIKVLKFQIKIVRSSLPINNLLKILETTKTYDNVNVIVEEICKSLNKYKVTREMTIKDIKGRKVNLKTFIKDIINDSVITYICNTLHLKKILFSKLLLLIKLVINKSINNFIFQLFNKKLKSTN